MPITVAGGSLTRQHQRTQAAIAKTVQRRASVLWPLLDLNDLDATSPGWMLAMIELIRGGYALSARAAVAYYTGFRAVELGVAPVPVVAAARDLSLEAVRTSLAVTGPVSVKQAMTRGQSLTAANANALVRVLGATQRHTLAGGRDTIESAATKDQAVIGYARVLGGEGCAFCVMLASRGAAYLSEDSAGFEAHDNCQCVPEPVLGDAYNLPTSTYDAMEKYRDATEPDGEWRGSEAAADGRRGQPDGSKVPQQVYELRRYLAASRA